MPGMRIDQSLVKFLMVPRIYKFLMVRIGAQPSRSNLYLYVFNI